MNSGRDELLVKAECEGLYLAIGPADVDIGLCVVDVELVDFKLDRLMLIWGSCMLKSTFQR